MPRGSANQAAVHEWANQAAVHEWAAQAAVHGRDRIRTRRLCRRWRRYENLVQVRCLLEGVPVDDVLADWHGLLGRYMEAWSLERSDVCPSITFSLSPAVPASTVSGQQRCADVRLRRSLQEHQAVCAGIETWSVSRASGLKRFFPLACSWWHGLGPHETGG